MPAIEVRPVMSNDLSDLMKFAHGIETTHTWQMDHTIDHGQIQVNFRRIRLPRDCMLDYPQSITNMGDTWKKKDLFLVARINSIRCGYLTLNLVEKKTGRVIDLVVDESFRRQGVASALLIAAQDWLKSNGIYRITLEMQTKNQAAISLAERAGFVFSGYMDGYFGNREIAFFYSRTFR